MADELVFNGIDGDSGDYLLPPLSAQTITQIARGEKIDAGDLKELKRRYGSATQENLGPKAGVNPKSLKDSGWGVLFAFQDQDKVPALKDALKELLDYRQTEAGDRYHEYTGPDAYRPGESATAWLARPPRGVGPGPADPDKVPYYLLIVGDPEAIPYRFQYQLDVQYAVGRIHFDTLEEYAGYARSVVAAEKGEVALPRQAAFWATHNPDDRPTQLSSQELTKRLADKMAPAQAPAGWTIQTFLEEQATKAQLAKLLGGDQTPALLFTASHGMSFQPGATRQLAHQGALLCQEWPGPLQWPKPTPIPHDFYFAGEDVTANARLLGLIAFHFACYGAGTPRLDYFAHQAFNQPTQIAPKDFIAALPRRLLGHPKGGALAAIGHVERAWSYSFLWAQAGAQLTVFESTLQELMEGYPIGYAVEFFNERYAQLSTLLTTELEDIKFGKVPDDDEVAGMWTANNDARSYVIVGDPAARLPLAAAGAAATKRPAIKVTYKAPQPGAPADAASYAAAVPQAEPQAGAEAQPAVVAAPSTSVRLAGPQAFVLSGAITVQPAGGPAQGAAQAFDTGALGAVDYGWPFGGKPAAEGEEDQVAKKSLLDDIKNMAKSAAQAMAKLADEAATLEVLTYTSDDLTKVQRNNIEGTANLRAITRITLGGDVEVCVPQKKDGGVDEALWKVHSDMVQQAQTNRAALIKTVVDAMSSLVKV
jgi:hypothetical protein